MTKVTHTEPFSESASAADTIVCKGKIILNKEYSLGGVIHKPVIISEAESIEVGDKVYDPKTGLIDTVPKGADIEWINSRKDKFYKTLALPENFSPEILKDIIGGKLRDGEEVLVESQLIDSIGVKSGLYRITVYGIKLNKNNHVTIYPVKVMEEWNAIEAEFRKTDGFKFNMAKHVDSAFISWIQDNYNPPTRK